MLALSMSIPEHWSHHNPTQTWKKHSPCMKPNLEKSNVWDGVPQKGIHFDILKLFIVSVLPTGFYNSSDAYGQRKLNTVMPFLWTFYPLNQKKK